ncbi:hypothetical protein Tco_0371045 [Tanacetum coccineum]
MRTRSQSRNSNRQQQQVPPTFVEPFNLVEPIENPAPPVVTMADNRTMAQLLEAPTEGYEDAIVVPEITADNFELKHGLLTLVQNKQFFGHDKEDPHAHIRYFNKITSTMKFPNVPNERHATPEPAWSIPSSSLHVPIHNWASAIASSYSAFIDRYNVSRPLPLGGPPGQVTIQTEFFFNKDLDYLQFGNKGDRLVLSIKKMKAAYYPDVRLEQMVPDQMWIEEECMYDISATYGISHWWFKRQKFYIDQHLAETNRRAIVRTHMRILSVVRIDIFSIYGLPEPPTAKGQEDSLLCGQPMDQESGLSENRMIMCFNEIHKFSDGTLKQIDEALDYRVKEFRVNKVNPGLNTRFWTTNDVIKSKQFMFAIKKSLKLKRIFRNLESFVGGRIREADYRLLQRTE